MQALTRGLLTTVFVAGLATGAAAQTKWDMPTPYGDGTFHTKNVRAFAEDVKKATDGKLDITVHSAGSLVKHPEIKASVRRGVAPIGELLISLHANESPIYSVDSVPFLASGYDEARQLYEAQKPFLEKKLGEEGLMLLYSVPWPSQGIYAKKEIKSLDDLKGLRFRTTGLNSRALSMVGAAVVAMSGPEAFQALQSGAIDAAEFIGPWTDSALGFQQVAPYYYWPGIGEPSSAEECGVNMQAYEALADDLKQAVAYACQSLYDEVVTEYNTRHAQSLRQLVADGTELRQVPEDVMIALGNAAGEVIAEVRDDSDELVQRIVDSFLDYRALMAEYMPYGDNGFMNARALPYDFG